MKSHEFNVQYESILNKCFMIVLFPIALLCRSILFSLGWSHIPETTFNHLNKYNRSVAVFSHTSYVDFYLLLLYLLSYPKRLGHIKTLMKPQPFGYAGWLLNRFGCIPSTKVDDKNGGAVSRIVSTLTQFNRYIFLISPKGTIVKREWRSGYYYIAKQLDAHLLVTGLDYEYKSAYASIPRMCT